jgi:hypothetical protein
MKIKAQVSQGDHHRILDFECSSTGGSQSLITPTSEPDSTTLVLPGCLSVPVEQQAPCFFVTNFVRQPRYSTPRGMFDFLLPVLEAEGPDSHVSTAFSAVALAALANRPNTKASGLMHQALVQYTKALKAINLALQNPAQQKSDATLAAIILMAFFEVGQWL